MTVSKIFLTAAVLIAPMLFATAQADAMTAHRYSTQGQGQYPTSVGTANGYTLLPGGLYAPQDNPEQGNDPYQIPMHRDRYQNGE